MLGSRSDPLKHNIFCLTKLSFFYAKIGDCVAENWKRQSLKILQLNNNKIGDDGMIYLLEALKALYNDNDDTNDNENNKKNSNDNETKDESDNEI